ncbi:basic leucine zipper 61-like [Olea europaea subsp. europaea]|uniref:Basic leucine zipper 61-like n=1 Tax=Olea europaea subsp. europaea TaxID=158383 RepID=A0A8S0TQ53_OLEEU|nr:basic leucine zipper 61-like [Olea europaea subsp. europaea]
MEHLPPKVPSMAHNWPSFPFQMMPLHAPQNSWVDEFVDFSSTRRSMYRRTASDPVAFVEESGNNKNGFERLDDEQLRDMFSDDMADVGPTTRSSSSPSSPSDQNGENNEKITTVVEVEEEPHRVQPKNEPGEVDSSCKPPVESLPPAKSSDNASGDTIVDPKRIKRVLANRQSAQRSRVRKLQYISELERSVTTLQSEVSALSPRVAFLDHQRLLLNVDNSALRQRIAALAQDKIFKDGKVFN